MWLPSLVQKSTNYSEKTSSEVIVATHLPTGENCHITFKDQTRMIPIAISATKSNQASSLFMKVLV
jgi:hypothetical protein